MAIILQVVTTTIFDSVEEAREVGQAVGRTLGSEVGIKINDTNGFIRKDAVYGEVRGHLGVPLHAPVHNYPNYSVGEQESADLANKIAKGLAAKTEVSEELLNSSIALDEITRRWDVDYKGMVETIKSSYPETYKEILPVFQDIVGTVLASVPLRGISMK